MTVGISKIVAIKRGEQLLTNPNVEEIIQENDELIVIGSIEQLAKLENMKFE